MDIVEVYLAYIVYHTDSNNNVWQKLVAVCAGYSIAEKELARYEKSELHNMNVAEYGNAYQKIMVRDVVTQS